MLCAIMCVYVWVPVCVSGECAHSVHTLLLLPFVLLTRPSNGFALWLSTLSRTILSLSPIRSVFSKRMVFCTNSERFITWHLHGYFGAWRSTRICSGIEDNAYYSLRVTVRTTEQNRGISKNSVTDSNWVREKIDSVCALVCVQVLVYVNVYVFCSCSSNA